MIDHEPWVGSNYSKDGGGLMLWGFSHHRPASVEDRSTYTQETIEQRALSSDHWFFNRLSNVCGGSGAASFWQSVAFANTLPDAVVDDIYHPGTPASQKAVKPRVMRILNDLKPQKVIVFTRKAWPLWPELNGSFPEPSRPLSGASMVRWGSYKIDAPWEVKAYNLPHPQFQNVDRLKAAVSAIRAHTI